MCLAVPGKILSIAGDEPLMRTGKVSFGGIVKEANLAFVPEAAVGDYVLVHAGCAISTVDEQEAMRVFEYLRQMDELAELEPAPPILTDPSPGLLRRPPSPEGRGQETSSPPSPLPKGEGGPVS